MDLNVDLDVDHAVDFDNDDMPRAVENAIRGCGPCSPEPAAAGGGVQWFSRHLFAAFIFVTFLFATFIFAACIFAAFIFAASILQVWKMSSWR